MNENDRILYFRFHKERDEAALSALIDRHRESLTKFLYGFVRNMEDAEELAVDTFAVISSGTAKYVERRDVSFKTWLFAVGRNQARLFLRKRKVIHVPLYDDPGHSAESPEELFLKKGRDSQLFQAMERLKPEYRQVLYLMYFEEMDHKEIGRVMKKSVKQIYNLATRGRKSLRDILERMESDDTKY